MFKKALFFIFIACLFIIFIYIRFTNDSRGMTAQHVVEVIQTSIKNQSLKEYQTSKHESITFYYKKSMMIDKEKVLTIFNETEKRSRAYLTIKALDPLKVIFYDDKSKFQNATGLRNVAAFYDDADRSINVLADNDTNDLLVDQRYLSHEYVHYLFNATLADHNIQPDDIPVWFQEGVAEYLSHINREYAEISNGFQAFKDQDTYDEWEKAKASSINPYHQAYIGIDELIKLKGENAIQQIIIQVGKKVDFYTAFEKVTGMKISVFENEVKQHLIYPK